MDNDDILKEEVTPETKDDTLIQLIESWIQETNTSYEALKKIIERNILYVKGYQTDVEKIRGNNSKAVENRIFAGLETMVPIVTARLPDMLVTPSTDDELGFKKADEIERVLAHHYHRVGIQELSERFVRDLISKRFGVFKIVWDSTTDDLGLKVIDPRRIRIPLFGSSVNELPFLIEELELSYTSLEELFGQETANKILKEVGVVESDLKKRKHTFTIHEIWTNEARIWYTKGTILKKEQNPFYDFKGSNNHFFAPQKPYIIKSLFQTEESLIGDTDLITQVIPVQDNINKRKRQIENLAAKIANPPLLIDSDVMDEETASGITNEEGAILYGKDVAQPGKVRFENPGQLPGYLFDDLLSSRGEFDNIFGTHSSTRGEKTNAKTLGQDVLSRQGDLGRIDLVARQLERAIGEIANYWVQVMKVMYDDKKVFRILGDEGFSLIEFDKSSIEEGVQVIVKAGTALPRDEVSIRNEALQLIQLGVLDPITLYEKLKFPNPQKTFERLSKFRTGQLFQEAGGQNPQAQSGIPGQENVGNLGGLPGNPTSQNQVMNQGQAEIQQAEQNI